MHCTLAGRLKFPHGLTARLLACIFGVAAFSGCVSPGGIDIEGRDTTAFAPGFRMTWETESVDGDMAWVGALDIDTTYLAGDDEATIGAGETIRFHTGPAIVGPTTVDTDFDFFQVQFSARGGFKLHNSLSMQGLVGLGGHHIRFEAENATVSNTQRLYSVGPHVGGRIAVHPADNIEVYGQARVGTAGGESGYDVEVGDFEAGVRVAPVEHIAFVGGWRWIRYEAEGHSGDSDIEIRLSGPMLMLQILF